MKYTQRDLDKISILSVKHTGTNFLHLLIRECVGEVRSSHFSTSDPDKLPETVISPIRNPDDVLRTWYSRSRFGPEFFDEWNIFNEVYLQGLTYVVPVDIPAGQTQLDKLAEKLDVKLWTDWKPVESMTRYEPPFIDISKIYELEVVKDFYGAIR